MVHEGGEGVDQKCPKTDHMVYEPPKYSWVAHFDQVS